VRKTSAVPARYVLEWGLDNGPTPGSKLARLRVAIHPRGPGQFACASGAGGASTAGSISMVDPGRRMARFT
jgi:hypothetical protein